MKRLIYGLIFVFIMTNFAWATDIGIVTTAEDSSSFVKKVVFTWTTKSGGVNSGIAQGTTTESYSGQIVRLVTVPDTTDVPSSNYKVAIKDEDGIDILLGQGSGKSATATEQVIAPNMGYIANDQMTLTVSSGGDSKKGTVYLYIR